MKTGNKWTIGVVSLAAAAVIGLSATVVYSSVYAQTETPEAPATVTPQSGKMFAKGEDHSALLAEVLGISEEELQTAVTTARNAMIDQAVADGRITQTQADAMKAQEDVRGWGRGAMSVGSDHDTALAEVLGITAEELQAAREEVQDRALAEAVAAGEITQAEADLMVARQALQAYMRGEQQAEYEATIAQAVTDGVITQAQADQLLSEADNGFFGFGRFGLDGFGMGGGRHGGHGRGMSGDMRGGHFGGPGRGPVPDASPVVPEDGTPESSNSPLFELPSINL